MCRQLYAVFAAQRGADPGTMMEAFIATGASRVQVERFLDADPDGAGSIRDQIAADMTNDLLRAFGQSARQTARDVKRLRARGAWVHLDRQPPE